MEKWIAGACALTASALAGCAGSLAQLSSGQVGCPPDEVTVSNVETHWSNKTWTATCRGRRYHCTGAESSGMYASSIHISCSPEGGSAAVASRPVSRAPVRTRDGSKSKVRRDFDEASGTHAVKATFQLAQHAKLRMAGAPAKAWGKIQIAYEAPSVSLRACNELDVLVNDVPHAATELKVAEGKSDYRLRLVGFTDFESYKPLAGRYPEFAIRVCDQTVSLSNEQIASLKKFLTIYSEMAAEHQRATTKAGSGDEAPPNGSTQL